MKKFRKYRYITSETMTENLETIENLAFRCCHSLNTAANKRLDRATQEFIQRYDQIGGSGD